MNTVFGQNCSNMVSGDVIDFIEKKPLENATLALLELNVRTKTDQNGIFKFNKICTGKYHLKISHIGCETKIVFIQLRSDSVLHLSLDHSMQTLHEVHVKGDLAEVSVLQTKNIKASKILENSNENLSTLLENINGVSSLKNGTISKPIIQGFSGNRLTILNNGVPQNGQQWGTDHALEIDPLVANKIQVIKGTASLSYAGSNAGNVILIQPANIEPEPHVHGLLNYFFESNGRGHGLRAETQQGSSKIAWRMGITYKNFGDRKAPDYFLRNTGNSELNGDLFLQKTKNSKKVELYFSTFNADLGLLRGSQIGNLEDLNVAFTKSIPFYTEPALKRLTDAPKQKVSHNLVKLSYKNFESEGLNTEAYIALQSNVRKEFDIRRNTLNEKPSLSINQNSLHVEYKIHVDKGVNQHFSTGVQAKIVDNTNIPETGILPLIPDYLSIDPSVFLIYELTKKNIHLETGLRYDGVFQNVKLISNEIPRRIIAYDKQFHNMSASAGFHTNLKGKVNLEFQTAISNRNPAINELFSKGLHQGVAGIELGNVALKNEQAFKNTLSINIKQEKWLEVNMSTYYNYINDYIYLKPSSEQQLTIRGAYPVFKYEQTDARIKGLDIDSKVNISKAIYFMNQVSLIQGKENKRTLVYLPQNRLKNELAYETSERMFKVNISYTHYFKYAHLKSNQDFIAVSPGFGLMAMSMQKDFIKNTKKLKLSININNALNTKYRMYLNRLRYYSDDLGRSVVIGFNVVF